MAENIIPETGEQTGSSVITATTAPQRRKRRGNTREARSTQAQENESNLDSVRATLERVGLNLVAIQKVTIDAIDGDTEWLLLLIRETARSSVRAIDASLAKLTGGGPILGNFQDDLSND